MVMNSFRNRIFMQPMRRLSRSAKCLHLFSFNFLGGGRGGGFFFIFPLFPTCSLRVPSGFISGSQYVPKGCWIGLCCRCAEKTCMAK